MNGWAKKPSEFLPKELQWITHILDFEDACPQALVDTILRENTDFRTRVERIGRNSRSSIAQIVLQVNRADTLGKANIPEGFFTEDDIVS